MRKLGKHKISIQKMNIRDKNEREWRLSSLYYGMVSGLAVYFSLFLTFLKLIKITDFAINIIGVLMAGVILMLLFFSENYKWIDKFQNKRSLNNILHACSISGIFGLKQM